MAVIRHAEIVGGGGPVFFLFGERGFALSFE
jgi:hypothetical protein